ncbi:MAG: M4 family metallopeptidase, partial [Bacteroidales bacterium]|nr:M4 family metallopeptidase [Bacteroidales bacterium]
MPDRYLHYQGTFYTHYYGIRYGNNSAMILNPSDTLFYLQDNDAAVAIYKLGPGAISFPLVPNTYYNPSKIWGNPPSTIYENYILDAYWAALQYVYYLRNHFNCPKGYFQRNFDNNNLVYKIYDTITPIFIADSAFYDNTHWSIRVRDDSTKMLGRLPHSQFNQYVIIVGFPSATHNPRASIDDVVHEFAHIFSFQTWHTSNNNTADDKLAEACADIWAAIITHEIYPNDESKIWKIGEDVVLPNSGNSCIRNLAVPNDPTAEMQMDTCICQESGGDAYQQSGIISHWFYLLTHGYSGKGCDGKCYAFNAIPIDSAAKLIYYCEMDYFYQGMTFSDIVQATIEAAEVFSNPSIIRQSICGAWNVMGASTCGFDEFEEFEVEQHYGLSFNAVNSGDYYVGSDIVIDSLQTLNLTGTIHMNDTCRLIVRPGGKLIVNGGTLTNACEGEMWEGIIVEGNRSLPQYAQRQGSVILNNATVENARNAISTRGADTNAVYEHTGGIVQATNTLFHNNRRTAEFLEYENHYGSNVTDNVSHFIRCSFTVDDDNLFASNGTSFLEHVSLWRVRGVKFLGCTFRNETSGSSTRGAGILSIEAGFTAKRVCPQLSNSDPCGCYNSGSDTVRRCSFTGFSEAVHAANTLGAYNITLDNCDFAYNSAGVSLYAAD